MPACLLYLLTGDPFRFCFASATRNTTYSQPHNTTQHNTILQHRDLMQRATKTNSNDKQYLSCVSC
ncbi:hypothetical protein K457DRAFT_612187 [Linnemannia elongata AG-77]|uniref:Uncharacterized protein n=1 Tax=Linnemannia elongata AG-77 TaxID=1314771 RepID=A0A197JRQ7_9FUNG|nr:hypothetical protein K457DRAFT_612187 [Linnemannia elongata AG-77]